MAERGWPVLAGFFALVREAGWEPVGDRIPGELQPQVRTPPNVHMELTATRPVVLRLGRERVGRVGFFTPDGGLLWATRWHDGLSEGDEFTLTNVHVREGAGAG